MLKIRNTLLNLKKSNEMYVKLNRPEGTLTIRLRWMYNVPEKKKTKETICIIEQQHAPNVYEIIATGTTRVRPGDVFIKKVGRIHALTNLFNNNEGLFSKQERTVIWNAYAEMVHYQFK